MENIAQKKCIKFVIFQRLAISHPVIACHSRYESIEWRYRVLKREALCYARNDVAGRGCRMLATHSMKVFDPDCNLPNRFTHAKEFRDLRRERISSCGPFTA